MTVSTHGWGGPASGFIAPSGPLYAAQLVDRRTGRAHRINGRALTLFGRDPEAVEAELMEGRDPRNWRARIERLATRSRGRVA